MITLVTSDWWTGLFKDDPVRPHIPAYKRISENKKAFVLMHDDGFDARAVICAAFCSDVPVTEDDLDSEGEDIVAFYTVWSYDKGAGREIIEEAVQWVKQNKPNVKRFVTLSPQTEMAHKFHTKNGAVLLQENETTRNYEYHV